MRAQHLTIEGPAGTLEAVAEEAEADGGRYAVICHPHPLFGGTMDNKVVVTLAKALRESGMATLRFNFRGVGGSAGSFDHGQGETLDAAAVAAYGAVRWPARQLVIAGFSFGSYVALRLAQTQRPAWLITVAPAVDLFDFAVLQVPACPWLVVQGGADEVVDPRGVVDWVNGLKPRPQFEFMPGVGHFFHGQLRELRSAVVNAVRSV